MNLGLPAREMIARIHDALARLGIEHLAEREPFAAVRRPGAAGRRRRLLAMRPHPSSSTNRPPSSTRRAPAWSARLLRPRIDRDRAAHRRAQDGPRLDGLCTRVVGPSTPGRDRRRRRRRTAEVRLARAGAIAGSSSTRPPSRPRRPLALAARTASMRRGGPGRLTATRRLDGRRAWSSLPGRDARPRRRGPRDPGRRHDRDHRAERQRQVDAGPPPERPAATHRGPRDARRDGHRGRPRRATWPGPSGSSSRTRIDQIFAGKVRSEVEFGPKILGRPAADVARAADAAIEAVGLTEPRVDEPVRPRLFAAKAAVARLDPGDGDAGPRARRADDGPGRAGRGPHPADHRARSRDPGGRSSRSATTCGSSPSRSIASS